MDHDVGIRQREPFALRPGAQQHRAHARGHADAIGDHVAGQELHRVVDRQPRRHRATGRVDVNVDILFRVFHLQEEQLRDHQIGHVIIDLADENDPILEQARVNVVAAFAPPGLLHHHWNKDRLRDVCARVTHDFSAAFSAAGSTLTFAFRKSRVLPSSICSANASSPLCSSISLRILSAETL